MPFEMWNIVAITVGLCILTLWRQKRSFLLNIIYFAFICIYFYSVVSLTILNRPFMESVSVIWIPGYAYFSILTKGWNGEAKYIVYGLIGNTILFVPLGMILGEFIKSKYRVWFSGVIGFCFSLLIELTQVTLCVGTFEADDLIQNTWGSVIGCSFIGSLEYISHKNRSRKQLCKMLAPVIVFVLLICLTSVWSFVKYSISLL